MRMQLVRTDYYAFLRLFEEDCLKKLKNSQYLLADTTIYREQFKVYCVET